MNEPIRTVEARPHQPLPLSATAACDSCGRLEAYEFEGARLCADCYQSQCSCCAGEE